jgi:membrane-bound serine protease (ClpP class)
LFSAVVLAIVFLLLKDRRASPRTGAEGMVGEKGVSITDIHGSGKVRVRGEIWNAISREPIAAEKRVRVDAVRGLVLDVSEER